MSNKHLIFIIFYYQLLFSLWQGRDDRRAAIPLVLKKHASLRRVAGLWIATKNTGDLRKRPVVSCGVSHHVARTKPTRQRSIPSVTQIAVIAISSFPSTIN